MTAIAAKAGAAPQHGNVVAQMLSAMPRRGADHLAMESIGAAALGGATFDWEREPSGEAKCSLVLRGSCIIAADATLYYRDDLRAAIRARNGHVHGTSSADLILAAYEAFGETFLDHLEGDFAFVLWDAGQSRLLAARDFIGKRPLFFHARNGGVTIASAIAGVIADESIARTFDLGSIAASASGLWSHFPETCYAGVSEVQAGHVLTWAPKTDAVVRRFWNPPDAFEPQPSPTDVAAEQLRDILSRAIDERMSPSGPTALTLSGGWDSTAVFGAGQRAVRGTPATPRNSARSLEAVSISYPEGDPGREDDIIRETTRFWNVDPSWIDIADIPMFARVRELARERDDPMSHPFEQWHRSLSRTSLATGARVMLDGSGGDQLFQVSDVVLADLVRSGRVGTAWNEWRSRGGKGLRNFLSWGVRPLLPDAVLGTLATLRRAGPPGMYLDRVPSAWFREDFLKRESVRERELAARPILTRKSTVLAEAHACLIFPYFPRVTSRVATFALAEGVEARSPLLDNRVVRFAMGRPWNERAHQNETKILLRRAVHGLAPDSVLAPRPHRTGITSGYFARSIGGAGRSLVEEMITNPILADMGMIDPAHLRRAWDYYLRTGHDETGARLYFSVQTELWLRERNAIAAGAQPVLATLGTEDK